MRPRSSELLQYFRPRKNVTRESRAALGAHFVNIRPPFSLVAAKTRQGVERITGKAAGCRLSSRTIHVAPAASPRHVLGLSTRGVAATRSRTIHVAPAASPRHVSQCQDQRLSITARPPRAVARLRNSSIVDGRFASSSARRRAAFRAAPIVFQCSAEAAASFCRLTSCLALTNLRAPTRSKPRLAP